MFKFRQNQTRIKGTLHEDQYTFSIISHSFLLRMKNISDKSCRETRNTHFVFDNSSPPKNHAVCEIMWKKFVEWGWPQMTIWHMHFACWIHKASNTHTSCVILVFPLQQRLHEHTSILHYTYIACLVVFSTFSFL